MGLAGSSDGARLHFTENPIRNLEAERISVKVLRYGHITDERSLREQNQRNITLRRLCATMRAGLHTDLPLQQYKANERLQT